MNSIKKKYFFIFILAMFFFLNSAFAQNRASIKKTAVFGIAGKDGTETALTSEAIDSIKKVFNDCGRFIPVDNKQLDAAYDEAKKGPGANIYDDTARLLNLDLYVTVSAYQLGDLIYSDINIVPINKEYENLRKKVKLRTRIKLNLPKKIGREIALLHKDLPLSARIVKVYKDSLYLIDAGEWHGIKNNGKYKVLGCTLKVIQAGRFESLAEIPVGKVENERIVINIYPDTDKIIDELNNDISKNTIMRYGLDGASQLDSKKRMIEGICIINMGSNACIPGYGAFLSTSYMGFDNPQPDLSSAAVSASAITMHFLLPEIMTDFKINFFPWKQDSDKTERMQNLQKFLWFTLPATFSAAYMDQLAFQFKKSEHMPPFFHDKDNMAAVLSLLIPGGGHYYKGNRFAGWAFYFSEMMLAGYSTYNYGNDNAGEYALYALSAVKAADVIYALLAKPSYPFYNLEIDRGETPSMDIGFRTGTGGDDILTVMISAKLH